MRIIDPKLELYSNNLNKLRLVNKRERERERVRGKDESTMFAVMGLVKIDLRLYKKVG